jgi:WD40 repeat protein
MPSLAPEKFVRIAYRCWESDPELRGAFVDILRDLSVVDESMKSAIAHDPKEDSALLVDQLSLVSRNMADLEHAVLNMTVVAGEQTTYGFVVLFSNFFFKKGRFVWASTAAPSIAIFDLSSNMSLVSILPVPVVITCLCAVDENYVWGGTQDGSVYIWRQEKGEWTAANKCRNHNNAVTAMRAFTDGTTELMLTGDLAGDLLLWNRRDLSKKPKSLSFPNQAVRSIVDASNKDICFVSLSTSVVSVRLSEDFSVSSTFALPGTPGLQGLFFFWFGFVCFSFLQKQGSVSGLLHVRDSLWIGGSRSIWLVKPTNLTVQIREISLPKTTSKVLALLMLRVGLDFAPCTIAVTSSMDLWDEAGHVASFTDAESLRHQGLKKQ